MAKEHPILFSAEMVRVVLDGRKTQTRRVGEWYKKWQVGDLLWVRENVRTICYQRGPDFSYGEYCIEYIADKTLVKCSEEHEQWWRHNWHIRPSTTIPSIFMPKWAARIWLEITGIKVERVQDMYEQDAEAEGAVKMHLDDLGQTWSTYVRGFQSLWDSINAKRGFGWDKNPWCWVIEFKRIARTR